MQNEQNFAFEYVSDNVKTLLDYCAEDFISWSISFSNLIKPHKLQKVENETRENSTSNCDIFEHEPFRVIISVPS